MFRIIIFITSFLQSSVSIIVVVDNDEQRLKVSLLPQSLMPGTHLFCVYGDNWFQSVRYSLRCLVAVPQDTDCVETIKTTEEKLATKKRELEKFQVTIVFLLSVFFLTLNISFSVRVLRD